MRSLKTKGFLRPFRSYNPPSDMESRFYAIVADILQADVSDRRVINATRLDDNAAKLRLLNALSREFSHRVHNSRLHQIKTVGNLNSYYRVSNLTKPNEYLWYLMIIFCFRSPRSLARPRTSSCTRTAGPAACLPTWWSSWTPSAGAARATIPWTGWTRTRAGTRLSPASDPGISTVA